MAFDFSLKYYKLKMSYTGFKLKIDVCKIFLVRVN